MVQEVALKFFSVLCLRISRSFRLKGTVEREFQSNRCSTLTNTLYSTLDRNTDEHMIIQYIDKISNAYTSKCL